jgi:hypothetical protein
MGLPPIRSMAAKLAIGLIAGSIFAGLVMQFAGVVLFLIPAQTLGGSLWQPFTFVFVENDPMGVIFGALILYSAGGMLESQWGSRRLLTFVVGTTFVSGLLTLGCAALFPGTLGQFIYTGGTIMASIAWVASGLLLGRGQSNFWGIPVTGNVLAMIGVGFVVLNAARAWQIVVPEVFALGYVFAYLKLGSPKYLWLRFQQWRLNRQLKGRSKHLKVIASDRNMPSDSDRFLH